MRISDWSSDVCSSDLAGRLDQGLRDDQLRIVRLAHRLQAASGVHGVADRGDAAGAAVAHLADDGRPEVQADADAQRPVQLAFQAGVQLGQPPRSEEHTSELQSLMRISYAVFCLKK